MQPGARPTRRSSVCPIPATGLQRARPRSINPGRRHAKPTTFVPTGVFATPGVTETTAHHHARAGPSRHPTPTRAVALTAPETFRSPACRPTDRGRARVAPDAPGARRRARPSAPSARNPPGTRRARGGEAAVRRSPEIGRLSRGQRDEIAHEEKRLDDEASSLREKAAEVEAKMYSGSRSAHRVSCRRCRPISISCAGTSETLENRELELMEAREPLDSPSSPSSTQRRCAGRGARPRRGCALAEARGGDRPGDGRGAQGA